MARLIFSKSSLHRENGNLKLFTQFLPALDLKRRQLMAEQAKAAAALLETQQRIAQFSRGIGEALPMLSNREVDLTDLVTLTTVELGEEGVVGIRLPVVESVEVEVRDYAFLGRPHWVDAVADRLRDMLELQVQARTEVRRLKLLDRAVKTITQRVNLFDKVLIPRTRDNIQRIQIFLSDAERVAVVCAKIAKRNRAVTGVT